MSREGAEEAEKSRRYRGMSLGSTYVKRMEGATLTQTLHQACTDVTGSTCLQMQTVGLQH